jgi:hypothetical protein
MTTHDNTKGSVVDAALHHRVGQGLSPHIDRVLWGNEIVGISVGAGSTMTLSQQDTMYKVEYVCMTCIIVRKPITDADMPQASGSLSVFTQQRSTIPMEPRYRANRRACANTTYLYHIPIHVLEPA